MLFIIFLVSGLVLLKTYSTIKRSKDIAETDEAYIKNYYQNHSWDALPPVVVQIPLYNEPLVATRIIDAALALNYPADKLEIQLLDDSTDDTPKIIKDHLGRILPTVSITHLRRGTKNGFKSGALDYGLTQTKAEFSAVFDADFIPPKDFLLNTIPHFFNQPSLAFIQTRWDYLNSFSTLFTRIQAASMFKADISRLKHGDQFSTFRGSGGVWRTEAIRSSGGWYTTSLCEDSNLSMRAYYNHWKSKYVYTVCCLCELPEDIKAYKNQRIRWSQGGMQNAIQMLKYKQNSSGSSASQSQYDKIKDFFTQSTSLLCFLFLLVLPSTLLLALTTSYKDILISTLEQILMLLACIQIISVYSYQSLFVGWKRAFLFTPLFFISQLMPLVNYSFGILKALSGVSSEFKRTPKSGGDLKRYSSLFKTNYKEKIEYCGILGGELIASSLFLYCALQISEYSKIIAVPFGFFSLCFALPFLLSIPNSFKGMYD